MAIHKIYNDNNKFLFKLKFKSKTLNILRNIVLGLVVILGLNWVIAITTDVNLMGTGFKKILEAMHVYTEPIPNVEITSDDWKSKDPGSWHIDKSAKWTGSAKAQVIFDLDTTAKTNGNKQDIIFVLDISGSMSGSKLERVKKDTTELLQVLLSDSANRAALVTFDTNARIVSSFTSDKDALIAKVEGLTIGGTTNYNDALLKTMDILANYQRKAGTDTIVLFLTDGYPCEDTPNQVGTFQILKDKYPYVTVNGIQYEMGSSIKQELKEVSDNQFYANMETLNNVLFDASLNPEVYEKFDIVDYIDDDYFKVNTKDDIKVTMGTVDLTNESDGSQKITWHIGDVLKSGLSAQMTIDLTLKDEYKDNKGFYPTNKGEDITTKLPSEAQEKQKTSNLTPVITNFLAVTYDYNPPSSCTLKNVTEEHYVYENVTKKNEKPVCAGYLFKGWEIVEDDVTKVNDDVFVMPEHNVTIRGTWSTFSIAKSFEGEVHEDLTLFKQVKQDAESNNGASTYTGEVTDEVDKTENTNIYYYTTATHNNVIFGDFCWQIVRTTATGGIKIVYNGVPSDGKCNNSGAAQQIGTSKFNTNYDSPAYVGYMYNTIYSSKFGSPTSGAIFGNDVTYDSGQYTLTDTGTTKDATHHYTCNSSSSDSCATVRYYYYYTSSSHDYIELTNGKKVEDALSEMLFDSDVNAKDSDIKIVIDTWYQNNMTDYTKYLEDTVFCNDRGIEDLGGWDSNGSISTDLYFNNYSIKSTHVCQNETDQFAMSNSKARLTYPVGLLTAPEANMMGSTFAKTGEYYWLGSPNISSSGTTLESLVFISGILLNGGVDQSVGVRPAVSLNPGTGISGGDGTNDNPYIVKPVTK